MIKRFGQAWHPLARLNLLVCGFFVGLQLCAIVTLLTIPTSIDARVAQFLLAVDGMWCLTSTVSILWLSWNAFQLSKTAAGRYHYTPRRNLIVAWVAPVVLVALIYAWRPLNLYFIDYRLSRDFDHSRTAMLDACDQILAEGLDSPLIRDNVELGAFSRVNILLRDGVVWFDVGDNLRAYGYVCVPPGGSLPAYTEDYDFERLDSRIYRFSEIENLLTPQPASPTPSDYNPGDNN
jgi:hypothetical protein